MGSTTPITPEPLLLSRSDLARLLRVSTTSLDRLRAAGRLPPAIRLGGALRWRRETIEQWLRELEHGGP